MNTDLPARYAALCAEASDLFGGERATCRMLGLAGHGVIKYRLEHPKIITREHILALETLVERVKGSR